MYVGGDFDEIDGRPYPYADFAAFTVTDTSAIEPPARHSADTDGDGIISLGEILRMVQYFNTFGMHCAHFPGISEDGFAPGPGEECQDCARHSGDYLEPAWCINPAELLRVIQFYNLSGYTYCPGAGTEDGYCVGSR